MSPNTLLVSAAINAFVAIGAGAFGAHGLRTRLTPQLLSAFETGAQYHFYHALGLCVVAFAMTRLPDSALLSYSGWLMLTGIVLFCGSLYALAITGTTWLGAITPLGGLAFLAAWLLMAVAFIRAA